MNIIEQATKRLEQLERAGVSVPWAAAGVAQGDTCVDRDSRQQPHLVDGTSARMPLEVIPQLAIRRQQEAMRVSLSPAIPAAFDQADANQKLQAVTLDLESLERSGYLVPTQ